MSGKQPVRMILLVDMDAFFASVEQAHHPHLRGKPLIVCGDPSRRGVVTAASYEARPFGVRAGMPLAEARRLCPLAELVEGSPEKYVGISLQLLDLYRKHTPDVEPFSVDEAFVGLDPKIQTLEAAAGIAAIIQRQIDERFGLGASIGIGPNKLIAKMASGVRKPRGLTALDEDSFQSTFWPRDVQELWGVGPKLAVRMRSLGIVTVGDLAHAPTGVLKDTFGIVGPSLKEAASGHDQTPLIPYWQGVDAKSMGHEVTLTDDSSDLDFLEGTLLRLADQVGRRLRSEGLVGRTVLIKLRNSRFETLTRQRALAAPTAECPLIYEVARALFRTEWNGDPLRLLGVSVTALERDPGAPQTELFGSDQRALRLREAMDLVRDRLGEASLVPAGSLTHRRELGHVPFGALSASALARETDPKTPKAGAEPSRKPKDPKPSAGWRARRALASSARGEPTGHKNAPDSNES